MPQTKKEPTIFVVTPFENLMAARGTRLPRLAQMLSDKGHRVEYVTTNFSHAYKRRFTRREIAGSRANMACRLTIIPILGYKINLSVRRIISNLVMSMSFFIYLVRAVNENDIIVTPSRPVDVVAMVVLLKLFINVTVVLDIRDTWPDALEGVHPAKKRLFTLYCNFFLKPSLVRIDRFVHISPSFVTWLHRYAPGKTSLFLPAGFDHDRWTGIQPKRHIGNRSWSLVFVGALQYQLDVMPLLKALVSRPHIRLALIGDNGTGQRYHEVKAFIQKHEMTHVKLMGRMPPDEVAAHLKRQDIGIVPMITSSIPNKVFDYMGAYLPIISLGDNDCSEFVTENGIGWTAPFDPSAIGTLIDNLTEEKVNASITSIRQIRDRYDRRNLYRAFVHVIDIVKAINCAN